MDKSLVIVDGALSTDSFLRTQLGLNSLFDFRVGGQPYCDILNENLLKRLTGHKVILTNASCSNLSMHDFKVWLDNHAPSYREYASIFLYPAAVYFQNFHELTHVIQRSSGSSEVIRLGTTPDLFALPVGMLDDANHQQRKLSTLSADSHWSIKSKLFNLESAADLFGVWSLSTEGRFFNTFEVSGAYVRKSSSMPDKSAREYWMLSHLPDPVKPFFPHVGMQDCATYEIEYVPCFDVARHLIHGNLNDTLTDRFLRRLNDYLEACPRRPANTGSAKAVEELFINKVNTRVTETVAQPKHKELEPLYALVWPGGFSHFHKTLLAALEPRCKRWSSDELAFSHGDLCLSNILFDFGNGMIKLIDPRGALTDEETYLPRIYDFAKLSHSFLGHYELIKNEMFEMCLTPGLSLDLKFTLPVSYLDALRQKFTAWLAKHKLDLADVRLAEASLFLSMIPLHQDDPRHQILMFRQAVGAYEESIGKGNTP